MNVSEISKSGNRSHDKTKKKNIDDVGFDKDKDCSKCKMPVRFYTAPEWNELSKGQQNFLRQHRHKKKTKEQALSHEVAEMRVTIAELVAKSKRKRVSDSESDNSDNSDNVKKTRATSTKRG